MYNPYRKVDMRKVNSHLSLVAFDLNRGQGDERGLGREGSTRLTTEVTKDPSVEVSTGTCVLHHVLVFVVKLAHDSGQWTTTTRVSGSSQTYNSRVV